jgi:hypothetical protein
MATIQIINDYIGDSVNYFLKYNGTQYLESYNKKRLYHKREWFNNNVIMSCDKFYDRFIVLFYKRYPNYIITPRHIKLITDFIVNCIEHDDSHEFNNFEYDDDPDDISEYIYYDLYRSSYDTKSVLRVYYDYYLTYSMNRIILDRMDVFMEGEITAQKRFRDAKRAIIVLNKIPTLNYDVISYISKYICGDRIKI